MNNILATILIILVVLMFFTVIVVIGVSLEIYLARIECNELENTTGHKTQFAIFGSGANYCLIEINGEMIPTSKWRINSGN